MEKKERAIRVNYDLELQINGISERVCKKISKELQREISPLIKQMVHEKHNVKVDNCNIELVDFDFLDK